VIAVNRLLHLGYSPSCVCVSSLNSLEVYNSSFIQVVKLWMMPVGFRAAEIFLVGPSSPLSVATNDWNIVLNVFQWQIQLQVIRLLRCSLMMGLISSSW